MLMAHTVLWIQNAKSGLLSNLLVPAAAADRLLESFSAFHNYRPSGGNVVPMPPPTVSVLSYPDSLGNTVKVAFNFAEISMLMKAIDPSTSSRQIGQESQ